MKLNKEHRWKRIAIVLFFALILSLFYLYFIEKPTNEFILNSEPINYNVNTLNNQMLGNDNAKVLVVEFSDFQCPFCKMFYDDGFKKMKEEYIDTGKVKFYYKHFPLNGLHPFAFDSALASECANEQDKFFEYSDILFNNQEEWSKGGKIALKNYAKDLQLDTNKFNECLDSKKYKDKVSNDFNEGIKLGIDGTPTFFINGVKIIGVEPYNNFKKEIEKEIEKNFI